MSNDTVSTARLNVDRELCLGAGRCVLTDPDLFDQDEDDGRVLLLTGPDEEPEVTAAVRRAVQFCPTGALTLSDG
ncbi:ferredoxin [Actinomadura decatromicini]|uniref:ferredoxin n=1 Tax=Actinomadura decatromicini TaxID=2604572 RepID=UPI001FE8F5F6|nr:ferredoxin [Actinomadura decatromicini]